MTVQSWDLYVTKVEIIVEHLTKHHSFPFNDRRSLPESDFLVDHFPELVKDMEDKELIFEGDDIERKKGLYLGKKGKQRLDRGIHLLRQALKFCEENSIPLAKIYWFNEDGDGEWRICKPTEEQLAFLKFKRWFASAEGYINKALLQERMLSEPEIDEMLKEFKEKVLEIQKKREKKREKKKTEIIVITKAEGDKEEKEE